VGKTRLGRKEHNLIQDFKYKIQQLKAENSALRKRLARIKLDEYGQLKKTIKKHYKKEETQQGNDILDKVRQEWKCHEEACSGFLEIFIYTRLNEMYYFRKCSESGCKNRTKAKKYDPQLVKGIIKKETVSE
jgi:predicted nuclease with TOPRIM domain